MLTIGCDFHSPFQQIAMLDEQTGEIIERRLEHETGEARTFTQHSRLRQDQQAHGLAAITKRHHE